MYLELAGWNNVIAKSENQSRPTQKITQNIAFIAFNLYYANYIHTRIVLYGKRVNKPCSRVYMVERLGKCNTGI